MDAGVVLAQAAVQEAFLAKAPAYAKGTGMHPGGFAWVGDGGEHEVIISPKTPTLMNLSKGSAVIPFSQINNVPGNLGAGLKAPSFSSSITSGGRGNSSVDMQAHEDAIHNLYGLVGTMAKHVANIQVNNDIRAANKAGVKVSYQTKRI